MGDSLGMYEFACPLLRSYAHILGSASLPRCDSCTRHPARSPFICEPRSARIPPAYTLSVRLPRDCLYRRLHALHRPLDMLFIHAPVRAFMIWPFMIMFPYNLL